MHMRAVPPVDRRMRHAAGPPSARAGSDRCSTSSPIARRTRPTPAPASRQARTTTSRKHAADDRSEIGVVSDAPTNQSASRASTTGSARDHLGHTRYRTSWRPCPCSSTAARKRAEPSGPIRTWMSQRSVSPPRMMLMHRARRSCSSSSRRSVCDRQCSLQTCSPPRPGEREGEIAAAAPRRQPAAQAPDQSRDRLEQEQDSRQAPHRRPVGRRAVRSVPRAANGLDRECERRGGEEQQLDSHRRARVHGTIGCRKMPTIDSSASRPIRRYHSGISGSAPSVLGVRS